MNHLQLTIPQADLVMALKRAGLISATARVVDLDIVCESHKGLELEVTFDVIEAPLLLRRIKDSDPVGTTVHVIRADGAVTRHVTAGRICVGPEGWGDVVPLEHDLLTSEDERFAPVISCLVDLRD